MSELYDLSADEHALLRAAVDGPLENPDPAAMNLCLRLCGRRLLQRAGAAALANGWRGSPHAFMLTQDGWTLLKERRRRRPLRQTG